MILSIQRGATPADHCSEKNKRDDDGDDDDDDDDDACKIKHTHDLIKSLPMYTLLCQFSDSLLSLTLR